MRRVGLEALRVRGRPQRVSASVDASLGWLCITDGQGTQVEAGTHVASVAAARGTSATTRHRLGTSSMSMGPWSQASGGLCQLGSKRPVVGRMTLVLVWNTVGDNLVVQEGDAVRYMAFAVGEGSGNSAGWTGWGGQGDALVVLASLRRRCEERLLFLELLALEGPHLLFEVLALN